MSVKCPSCGFDSQDDAAWCDFCKEPFRKKEPPRNEEDGSAAPGPSPQGQAPASRPEPTVEETQRPGWKKPPVKIKYLTPPAEPPATKTPAAKTPAGGPAPAEPEKEDELPPEILERLPKEFITGQGLEKMPQVPGWFRVLAWLFFGAWLLTGLVLGGMFLGRYRRRAPAPAPTPGRASPGR